MARLKESVKLKESVNLKESGIMKSPQLIEVNPSVARHSGKYRKSLTKDPGRILQTYSQTLWYGAKMARMSKGCE